MKAKQNKVLGLLDTRQTYHSTQSIGRWKQAINAFESKTTPSRVILYDMYDDIMLDGHLECVWQKRLDAILNRRLSFVRNGIEDEEISKLLNSPDMRLVVTEIMRSIAYGFTLIQVNNITYNDDQECYRINFDLIPRKHVHPEAGFECVSKDQTDQSKDFLFTQPPLSNYMMWAGDPESKGLLVKAAPYVIYKRGGFGDWAQFSEMFGMPFREAIYDSYDDDTRTRIRQFLEEWSTGSYLVHQRDVELKIHDTGGSSASADVYDRLIRVCDAGISKVVVGNTLTTEQGDNGARSLGEVHENEQQTRALSDERMVLSVLNTQFRAILKRFGINVAGGDIWFDSPETDWSAVQTKWDVISSVAQQVPVDDDYIYEEIGIPKPDNYDQLKREQEERRRAIAEQVSNQPDDSTAGNDRKRLFARLSNFFGVAPERP